jgi:hypothetical protein
MEMAAGVTPKTTHIPADKKEEEGFISSQLRVMKWFTISRTQDLRELHCRIVPQGLR